MAHPSEGPAEGNEAVTGAGSSEDCSRAGPLWFWNAAWAEGWSQEGITKGEPALKFCFLPPTPSPGAEQTRPLLWGRPLLEGPDRAGWGH